MEINTVYCECFVIKIFSDSLAFARIKCVRNINDEVVQGRLSKKLIIQHEIIA